MENFKEISIRSLKCNPVDIFDKKWALVTAGSGENVNTMTISWGSIGELWGKPVAFTFIRPQRYTKQFVDNNDSYSLCFFTEDWRRQLSYLGTVSGKDENKIEKAGLTVEFIDGTPVFKEAELIMICKKLYKQDLNGESFLDKALDSSVYPTKDYHTMYVSDIVKVLERQ
ncbi:MAG: flavin reductase family protein [Clostridia bacterium]|nr:flavin reductase family protein [Clostridia bacterium]